MSIEDNKRLVTEWVEALDAGDTDRVCSMYAEDLYYYVVGKWPLGGHFDRDYMENNCADIFTVFPEGLRFEAVRMVAEGDWVCLEMRSGGHHVGGTEYGNHYTYWFEIRDGKITQLKEWLDTLHANEVLCSQAAPIDFEQRRSEE